ncbi:hypothetical protein [Fluviispira vulneris]|uniref:hypothetical protein n=1 Tax=Fluviispira vulneris TaxID=2763012 RepID=UPI0016478D9D|nr:hypothetical protein [Fluviispira vulneris]
MKEQIINNGIMYDNFNEDYTYNVYIESYEFDNDGKRKYSHVNQEALKTFKRDQKSEALEYANSLKLNFEGVCKGFNVRVSTHPTMYSL